MKKNQLLTLLILLVAVGFIINTVLDNQKKEEAKDTVVISEEQKNEQNSASVPFPANDEVGLQRGNLAPDFTLPLWDGGEAALSDYRGQIVVLNLWASWCPPCRREMPDLISFYENYKDEGIVVLGVNLATLERSEDGASQFMEEYGVSFPTFVDQPIDSVNQRGIVASLYNINAIPATYILDQAGRIFIAIRGEVQYEMLVDQVNKVKAASAK